MIKSKISIRKIIIKAIIKLNKFYHPIKTNFYVAKWNGGGQVYSSYMHVRGSNITLS